MTDQTIPDVTDEDRTLARSWAEHIIAAPGTSLPMETAAARVILHAVPAPTLADMTWEERAECQWMQCEVRGDAPAVILRVGGMYAHLVDGAGVPFKANHADVTPRPDLPPLTWPGEQQPAPSPALPDELTYLDQEDYPPRDQLTLGGKWADITKLEEALRQKGEAADQAIVLDNDGDAYVWQAVGRGGWMIRIPAQQYGPFRLILNDQEADQ